MSRKEKQSTRIILVRHLDTPARRMRASVKTDPKHQELRIILREATITHAQKLQASLIAQNVIDRYGYLPFDFQLPITSDQHSLGQNLGKALAEKLGLPDRWEVSPFLRARQTSAAMREGMRAVLSNRQLPQEIVNSGIGERNDGDASRYPSRDVYFATHWDELQRSRSNSKDYGFPQGESKKHFRRRIGRQVWREMWFKRYEGKTTVMVSHSLAIEEQLRRFIGLQNNDDLWTGSVTVIEAEPKKFLRPRRFHLVGQVGQRLV